MLGNNSAGRASFVGMKNPAPSIQDALNLLGIAAFVFSIFYFIGLLNHYGYSVALGISHYPFKLDYYLTLMRGFNSLFIILPVTSLLFLNFFQLYILKRRKVEIKKILEETLQTETSTLAIKNENISDEQKELLQELIQTIASNKALADKSRLDIEEAEAEIQKRWNSWHTKTLFASMTMGPIIGEFIYSFLEFHSFTPTILVNSLFPILQIYLIYILYSKIGLMLKRDIRTYIKVMMVLPLVVAFYIIFIPLLQGINNGLLDLQRDDFTKVIIHQGNKSYESEYIYSDSDNYILRTDSIVTIIPVSQVTALEVK